MSNDLVWKRSTTCSESEDDNVWDDRALVNAYDKAVRKVNAKIAGHLDSNEKNSNNNQWKAINSVANEKSSKTETSSNDWHLGQYCRSVYSEDGIEYESQIISINPQNNTCVVKYVGYGNEEEKALNDLKPSLGKRNRKLQSQQFETQHVINSNSDIHINSQTNNQMTNQFKQNKSTNRTDSSSTSSWFMPSGSEKCPQPIVPPPLPFSCDSHMPNDDESLASMLMSWYMSGYHTGYYRALKQFKLNCKCNK